MTTSAAALLTLMLLSPAQEAGANTQGTPSTPPASDQAALRAPPSGAPPAAAPARTAPASPAPASAAPSSAPAGAPSSAPAAEAAPEVNPVEAQMNKLPAFLWDKDQPLQVRITRFSNWVVLGLGILSLTAGLGFLALTATLQLSPFPEDSDPRERPRATFIIASMVTTTLLFLGGAVAVLGALFTIIAV